MKSILSDAEVVERIFHHIDEKTTDLGDDVWREPVANYLSTERFDAEIGLMRRLPVAFCPVAAVSEPGSYVARRAAGVPLLVVRGDDGELRAFRNACRHRGMPVADGHGRAPSFVCPYHAWVYGLNGELKHVAGRGGFPGLNADCHGLVPVHAVDVRGGMVFVTQNEPVADGALDAVPDLIGPHQVMFDQASFTDNANWKLIAETSMEGYHIRALHTKSFFPYGYDNLNVVETHGPNSRIIFPFRRIEKLRDVPPPERRLEGMVTDVHQLFPNTHLTVLSSHTLMVVLEPLSPTETEWVIYRLSNKSADANHDSDISKARRDASFVADTGLEEDRNAACSIQASFASAANEHLTFGRFEKAAVHFHRVLDEHLETLT